MRTNNKFLGLSGGAWAMLFGIVFYAFLCGEAGKYTQEHILKIDKTIISQGYNPDEVRVFLKAHPIHISSNDFLNSKGLQKQFQIFQETGVMPSRSAEQLSQKIANEAAGGAAGGAFVGSVGAKMVGF